MTKVIGPVWLRWRGAGAEPEMESFPDLDAAVDAVVARWDALAAAAPQLLDGRKVLLASTDELRGIVEEETAEGGAE
jgi:hypothetical protein